MRSLSWKEGRGGEHGLDLASSSNQFLTVGCTWQWSGFEPSRMTEWKRDPSVALEVSAGLLSLGAVQTNKADILQAADLACLTLALLNKLQTGLGFGLCLQQGKWPLR